MLYAVWHETSRVGLEQSVQKETQHYIIFNNLSTFKDEHFKLTGYLDLFVLYQSIESHIFPTL